MAKNFAPQVAAARDIGEKFNKDQVIIFFLDRENETLEYASWGKTEYWCKNAKKLADIAYKKIAVNA